MFVTVLKWAMVGIFAFAILLGPLAAKKDVKGREPRSIEDVINDRFFEALIFAITIYLLVTL